MIRSNSDVAVPIPGIRADSAAAPRRTSPLLGRPRANATAASITVDTMLSLFADWSFVAVIRAIVFGVDTKKGGRRSGPSAGAVFLSVHVILEDTLREWVV
jgi:hypothetical protein